jgi:hypothetical protein
MISKLLSGFGKINSEKLTCYTYGAFKALVVGEVLLRKIVPLKFCFVQNDSGKIKNGE